jgi:hypothetical protein
MCVDVKNLAPTATMPIDVPPWRRQALLRLLTVSARRMVIFQDDFGHTVAELQPLIAILAPAVIPVLGAFIRSEATERPRTHMSSARRSTLGLSNNNAVV